MLAGLHVLADAVPGFAVDVGETLVWLALLPMLGLCKAFEKLRATVPMRANQSCEIEKLTVYGGPSIEFVARCGIRRVAMGSTVG